MLVINFCCASKPQTIVRSGFLKKLFFPKEATHYHEEESDLKKTVDPFPTHEVQNGTAELPPTP